MQTTVTLSPDIQRRLESLARLSGRGTAQQLQEVIAAGLADMEDDYTAAATAQRVKSGQESVVSLDEVERRLGLAD